MENRAFEEMRKAACKRLEGRDPAEISRKATVTFDGFAFRFSSLGESITVSYPDFAIQPEVNWWYQLLILHYLDLADGCPLSDHWITFGAQRDGLARGVNFDRSTERCIQQELGRLEPDELRRRCAALGGREVPGQSDLRVVLPFLPMYPVTLNLWFTDEEFPASGRLLLNGSAEHYLTIEDSVTVGELILSALKGEGIQI